MTQPTDKALTLEEAKDKIAIKSINIKTMGADTHEECNGQWRNDCPYPFCHCAKEYLKVVDEDYQEEQEAMVWSGVIWFIFSILWCMWAGASIVMKLFHVIEWSWWFVLFPIWFPVLIAVLLFLGFHALTKYR